jgi:2-polyprenyl-3-methyl-5-hydroxy-6-metoxy-1,4-benzoquinol methylase
MDEQRAEELMGQLVGYMTGGAMCFAIWLGDELGLYRALAEAGPTSAESLAKLADCHPRLVREWLDSQAAGRLVRYEPATDHYELSEEAAAALADEASPVFVARATNALGAMFFDLDKVKAAFRGDGALAWGDHHPCLFSGTEWMFRTGYRAYLPNQWLPAVDGAEAKLRAGAAVADVGCGHGAAVVALAEAYPQSQVWGFDFHPPSIDTARRRAVEAGVADRVTFEVATARSYQGSFDLISFLDCLHDMGDPVGAARYAREHLRVDGTLLVVEPFALDGRRTNIEDNPMAALMYTASTAICTPNSLSQEVGLGLGAQAGEERLREVMSEAGFTSFHRVAETPLNLVFAARP